MICCWRPLLIPNLSRSGAQRTQSRIAKNEPGSSSSFGPMGTFPKTGQFRRVDPYWIERHPTLRQHILHHISVYVREAEVPVLTLVGQLLVVDAETMKDGRVQVVNFNRIGRDVVAIVIRFAEGEAWLNSSARKPHREAARVMVAAIILGCQLALTVNRAAKLAAPDHKRVLE